MMKKILIVLIVFIVAYLVWSKTGRNDVEDYKFKPITINVTLLNEKHEPMTTWNFVSAYPVKWEVSNLDATKNEVVVDTIEIAYKYFTRI